VLGRLHQPAIQLKERNTAVRDEEEGDKEHQEASHLVED